MLMNFANKKTITVLLSGAIFLLLLCIAIMASVPPVSRDALTHHLAVPKLWIEKGIFTEIPTVLFSYYPMNIDLLYMIPLYWGNDIIPKYIHFALALVTALLIYRFVCKRINRLYALLGAFFFLSTPIIIKLSTTVYVDLGLICVSTASILGLITWSENNFRPKYIVYSALWCGLALGTKYNALIVLLLLSSFIPFIYLRSKTPGDRARSWKYQSKALMYGVFFVVLSLLVFSPWMIRNTILTQNPIYPLYNSLFQKISNNGVASESDTLNDEDIGQQRKGSGWKHFAIRKIVYKESIWEICLIPFRVFFEGRDDDPKRFDGVLNPFLLVFPLFLFLPTVKSGQDRGAVAILVAFTIGYLIIVFFRVDMRIRWISPIVPPLVILSMFGLRRLQCFADGFKSRFANAAMKSMLPILVLAAIGMNTSYLHSLFNKIDPLPYLSGKVDRAAYLKRYRPEYELISNINDTFPEDAHILCLFIGNRIYYFDRRINLNINVLKSAVAKPGLSAKIGKQLNDNGITHILLRYDLFNAWIKNNLNRNQQARLTAFFHQGTQLLQSHGGYGLYQIENAINNDN